MLNVEYPTRRNAGGDRMGHSSLVVVIGTLLLALAVVSPAVGQLDLGGPTLPGWFFTDRLSQLDQRIAEKQDRIKKADPAETAVIEAQKNLLLIAQHLIIVGRDAGKQGHLATLYGLTIADGAASFDQLTDALPGQINKALKAKGNKAQRRVEKLAGVVKAIRAFNAAADDEKDERPAHAPTAKWLDAYLRKALRPLVPVAQTLGGRRVRSTWAVLEPTGAISTPRLQHDLKQLDKRLNESKIDKTAVPQMHQMIGLLIEAAAYPDMRPRTAALTKQVERLIDVADKLSRLNWLDERARAQLNKEVRTTTTLMMDPASRPAALKHINRMEQLCQPAIMLTTLTRIKVVPIGNPRKVFAVVLALQNDPKQAKTAEALTAWLSRLTTILIDHRRAATVPLPLAIRKVLAQLQQQYDALEKQTLDTLPALAAAPDAVTKPKWTEPLTRMATLTEQMNHLAKIPDWARRMNRINPSSVRGLYKQYLLIAQDLLKPATSQGAAAALSEMDRQLTLFERMPGEDLLTRSNTDMAKLLGDRRVTLLQQLLVLRSQWAAAWGAGIDPTPAGRKLLLMRRLMSDLTIAAKLPQIRQAAAKLNRWAAWQAPVEAWTPVQGWLINQLRLAQQQAADGKWSDLNKTLDRTDAAAAALELVTDLSQRLDPAMDRIGNGFPALLSQCLFSPGKHALAAGHREDLARWCVYLTAAADAHVHHPNQTQTMSRIVGDLAIPLRAALAMKKFPAAAGLRRLRQNRR